MGVKCFLYELNTTVKGGQNKNGRVSASDCLPIYLQPHFQFCIPFQLGSLGIGRLRKSGGQKNDLISLLLNIFF